jgi:RNA polymerase sigma factor (TIGR02999 family)
LLAGGFQRAKQGIAMAQEDRGARAGEGGSPSAARGAGDGAAPWTPAVYHELHRLAEAMFHRERRGHTLQPTALVHEAYIQLRGAAGAACQDESHFLATAARVMRHILVDHARGRAAAKRGGGRLRVSFETAERAAAEPAEADGDIDLLDLEDVLAGLAALDERKARVAELRLFGGATSEQVGRALGISTRTAEEDWHMARAWLKLKLSAQR